MPNDAIHPPWSEAVIVALNHQQFGIRHSYTCPLPNHPVETAPKLVATRGGWICSHAPDCGYTQDWAHLADVSHLDVPSPLREQPAQGASAAMKLDDEPLTLDDIAGLAYEAYSRASGGKAFNGDPLLDWERVNPQIQSYWRAAMRAVRGPLSQPPRVGSALFDDLAPPGSWQ